MDPRPKIILRLGEVYDEKFRSICESNHRKFVDQVKVWIDAEEKNLTAQKPLKTKASKDVKGLRDDAVPVDIWQPEPGRRAKRGNQD